MCVIIHTICTIRASGGADISTEDFPIANRLACPLHSNDLTCRGRDAIPEP